MKRTKELLTDTFWELLEEKAYSKITVNDIVSRCDVNRNTFYYHFQDIPSLMINSIEKWADGIIKEYAISEKSVNCLSYMAQECTKRKKAMLHLFRSVEKEKLLSNMNEIAYHIICTYANEMKEKRNISEQDKETLIQCYKCFSDCRQSPGKSRAFLHLWPFFWYNRNIRRAVFFYDDKKFR